MIEMSLDKETVLSCEGQTDPSYQQHSEHSRNNTSIPGKTTGTSFSKKDSEEPRNETSQEHNDKNSTTGNGAVSECSVLGAESGSTKTQNDPQQSKPQQQRLNKRRNTMSAGFKHPCYGKRRRRANSESESVLPTNFLLGGNIFDPLNLNSLLDEEVNRALNAETPKSSPLPAKSRDPVEILIPRDITDPLNLNCPSTGGRNRLVSPLKNGGGKRRHRNKHHGAGSGGGGMVTQSDLPESKCCTEDQTGTTSHFKSGSVVDSLVPEALKEDNMLLISTFEVPCSKKPNLSTNGGELKEKIGCVPPTNDNSTVPPSANPTNPSSSKQRKRKRAMGRLEDGNGSNGARNWAPRSGGHSQPFYSPGPGPRTGGTDRPQQHLNHWRSQNNDNQHQQQQKKKFQFGNYNKYYGYRNPGLTEDPRICVLKPEWFQGKVVLDLGCNTGHLTLSIAKNWRPARIVGLDIDGALIHAARQNIRHYLSELHTEQARRFGENGEQNRVEYSKWDDLPEEEKKRKEKYGEGFRGEKEEHSSLENKKCSDGKNKYIDKGGMVDCGLAERENDKGNDAENKSTEADHEGVRGKIEDGECVGLPDGKHSFPVSLRISRGPIAGPPLSETNTNILPPGDFPANITFVKGNYVLESDALLQMQREEYDVILCLSVTKWVHLNWGDDGLKRLFQRVYRHLRPGGLFILEPQPWNSYSKRKKLTDAIYKNYHSICFKPEQFSSYLTTEVGFSSYELIGTPQNFSRGFQRPIYLFHKGPSPQK
ncbi:7SK snRNA methylphosphate capping enzyme-like [Xyrauchen texanus]|uniref:7SK snRNA methylphosphate capping enzyme-like n=1 Tax=Xyrauchen texanus TaxID=154827 RepID=UPI0022429D49|nr:7SK snRNA methylphosphate capping enzyme-like [Xyrauchen texanus]XP_051976722.1 7SK snRNA methylphosphate capping enzyme-like [Xyrauchen texanus]XP_051976727.1 7SK snRNA methylphosphate capping enzyme-like [Xyrauchen texanus]